MVLIVLVGRKLRSEGIGTVKYEFFLSEFEVGSLGFGRTEEEVNGVFMDERSVIRHIEECKNIIIEGLLKIHTRGKSFSYTFNSLFRSFLEGNCHELQRLELRLPGGLG